MKIIVIAFLARSQIYLEERYLYPTNQTSTTTMALKLNWRKVSFAIQVELFFGYIHNLHRNRKFRLDSETLRFTSSKDVLTNKLNEISETSGKQQISRKAHFWMYQIFYLCCIEYSEMRIFDVIDIERIHYTDNIDLHIHLLHIFQHFSQVCFFRPITIVACSVWLVWKA